MNLNFWKWGRGATQRVKGDQSSDPSSYGVSTPKSVTEESSLQVSAVWACVRLLSETVASLPLNLFEDTKEGRKSAKNNPLYRLLHDKPNQYMTSVSFREAMMLNLCLHGNAYAEIERNARGEPIGLNPLPARQTVATLLEDGSMVYAYTQDKQTAVIAKQNMLHIKLFGNGLIGLSPLAYARNAIGLSLGAEEFASKFYQNGGKPGGILTIDKVLSDDQRKAVRINFGTIIDEADNVHSVMDLDAVMN